MIILDNKKVLIGGFHEHWHRIDTANVAYLLSALNYYHYDFVTLMDGVDCSTQFQNEAARFTDKIKLFPGREYACPWGHIVAVGFKNNCNEDNLYNEISKITDMDAVFKTLKKAYKMVVLAHPTYEITYREVFLTGEIDRLIDDNLIDAVNIINSTGLNHASHLPLIDWYKKREIAGKRTPIVGGWDAHLIFNRVNDPDILYTDKNSPKGHIDTAGENRSVIIDVENNLDSIIQAVKDCRVVIEDIETGEFIGPSKHIDFLKKNCYNQKITELVEERAKIEVNTQNKWFINEEAKITFNQDGELLYPTGRDSVKETVVIANKPVSLQKVGLDLVRDEVGMPISFTNQDGFESIYSVRASHPIRIDVLPKYEEKKQYLEIKFIVPFEGNISFQCDLFQEIQNITATKDKLSICVEVDVADTAPVSYTLVATNVNGVSRSFQGLVNFYGVPYFDGSWDNVPCINIDKDDFVPPELEYGATEPWVGAERFSGDVQVAWTIDALLMRVDIVDDIHDQPLEGHFLYDADCVQVAFDPLYLRRGYRGHIYNYNLALTKTGPELFQMFTPDLDENDNIIFIPEDLSLGDKYLKIEKTPKGLVYNLSLPWSMVGHEEPQAGDRMGIYIILLNSIGNGAINNLKWPIPIEGMWLVPKLWGTISLMDEIN